MDRIVIFMNSSRGLSVMRKAMEAGHGLLRAYTPDGHGGDSEVAAACRELEVELSAAGDVNAPGFIDEAAALGPRLFLIAGYPSIFRRPLFETPELGTVNLHAGRLPAYRGGSPLNWQIINGEAEAGISVTRVEEGIDSGPVLAAASFPIGPDDTIAEAHEKANRLFPSLVIEVLDKMDAGTLEERPQNRDEARYWHQRNPDDGRIDWPTMSARQVHDLVRAVTHPYPGAFSDTPQGRVRIFKTSLPGLDILGVPGRVCWLHDTGPYVVCADRAVLLETYLFEDGAKERLGHGVHLA